MLKEIGTRARTEIEDFLQEKVFLEVIKTSKNTSLPQNYKRLVDKINTKF